MAELLDAVEIETGAAPDAAVIWMHGLGADGHDFESIVPELSLMVPVRFVFPHAPMQAVTINGGAVMRAWYDVYGVDGVRREDAVGVRASETRIEALIARERNRGVAPSRIVLAGFSQGGAMAIHTGLRHAERLAGIMALSCFVPLADALAAEASAANRETPIFMAHGTQDPLIPMARAQSGRDLLVSHGYRVEWHEYRMPHSVCAEEITEIGNWLRKIVSGKR